MSRYTSFIVRISVSDGRSFHGYVVHVATQDIWHFRNVERMIDFIRERTEKPADFELPEINVTDE